MTPKQPNSKPLQRLLRAGLLIHLARGRWALRGKIDPLVLPEYLTAPYPAYISLQTALFYHRSGPQVLASI